MAGDLAANVAHYGEGLNALEKAFEKILPEDALRDVAAEQKTLAGRKVPKALAQKMAQLAFLSRGPDIILVAAQNKKPIVDVARVFYGLGASLSIDKLAAEAAAVPVVDYYERLAVTNTLDGIYAAQRHLTAQILRAGGAKKNAWEIWSGRNQHTVDRAQVAINELLTGTLTLAKLAVAGSHLRDLSQA